MRPLILSLPLLLSCTGSPPDPTGRAAAGVLRVLTWNVHDLFDAADRLEPPGAADEVPSPEEVERKLERVAAVLRRLDADVALLQEVENAAILAALASRAGYPHHRLVEGFDPRGIDVAVLSRAPIARWVSHLDDVDADGAWLWARDCAEIHLDGLARPVVIVGAHLVSRLSDDGTRRARQAARLRAIADAASARPGALVLAGGDLNDPPDAPALEPLAGDGAWVDPGAEAAAFTWFGAAGAARLDALLVRRADVPSVLRHAVEAGEDVAAASDHRPVVLDLWTG